MTGRLGQPVHELGDVSKGAVAAAVLLVMHDQDGDFQGFQGHGGERAAFGVTQDARGEHDPIRTFGAGEFHGQVGGRLGAPAGADQPDR